MPQDSIEYAVPDDFQPAQLVARLRAQLKIRHQADSSITRVFYDTFDWRLFKQGAALEVQKDEHADKVYWRSGKRDRMKIQLAVREVPALAAELPDCNFRRQLQLAIGRRELIPCINARVSRRLFTVLDDRDKVVVRIAFDDCWVSPSKTRADRLMCRRVTAKPVKGFAENFREVTALLEDSGLNASRDSVMRHALLVKGMKPGEYRTRVSPRLDPDSTPLDAAQLILLNLLEIMQLNTSGVIRGKDTEYLHDYRVALMKVVHLIDLLEQSGYVVVDKDYRERFILLDKLTWSVRQRDLFIHELDDYLQQLDQSEQQALQALLESLHASRAAAQDKLADVLGSSAYKASIGQWKKSLKQQGSVEAIHKSTEIAGNTALEWVDETAWAVFDESKKQGNAYKKNQKRDNRCKLRQSFERLVQLMEFFQSYYSMLAVREMSGLLSELAGDLEKLDEFYARIDMVEQYRRQFSDDSANQGDLQACESLLMILQQQSDSISKHFFDIYPDYSSVKTRNIFKEMFIDYHTRQDSEEDSDL